MAHRLSANGPERHPLPSTLLHDLRTPLNQIIGYSEMLSEQAQEAGYVVLLPDLQKVCNAGQNLLLLINGSFAAIASEAPASMPKPAQDVMLVESLRQEPLAPLASGAVRGFLLVVDDDEGNRDVLSRRLEMQGYAVDTADSGERAIEMLESDTFDLVLLDILMAGMDGFDVLKAIRASDRTRNIPVIMISALDELDSVARCIEMGAEDYLSKPFNPTLLQARIGACLEKKRSRDRESLLFEQLQGNYRRLQELEKLRDDLTHMIIHDLRTPLTSLIVGMQTMDSMGDLNTVQKEMLDIAVSGGGSLLGMINDLLDVEKLESGTMQINCAPLTPASLVASAVAQVASLAEAKGLPLTIEVAPDLPSFMGDEKKLSRTLVNLLGNAIHFTAAGGLVTIAAREMHDEQEVQFSVTDTGEGIPADAFDRIFEKFGQVESRSSAHGSGSGLGLTFCKLAVEAHGGKISVESTPNTGSKFSFSIPLKERHLHEGATVSTDL